MYVYSFVCLFIHSPKKEIMKKAIINIQVQV